MVDSNPSGPTRNGASGGNISPKDRSEIGSSTTPTPTSHQTPAVIARSFSGGAPASSRMNKTNSNDRRAQSEEHGQAPDQEQGFQSSGMLSPSASSTASFVFPVRSVFANLGTGDTRGIRGSGPNAPPTYNQPPPEGVNTIDYAAADYQNRDRSPSSSSNTTATQGSSISSILAQGQSIQNMLESYTYDLSELHKNLPWYKPPFGPGRQDSSNSDAGPSSSRPPGMMGAGCYSAPLPTVPETNQSEYFINAMLEEGRRKSDGEKASVSAESSPAVFPSRFEDDEEDTGGPDGSLNPRRKESTDSARHAHGQVDPAPKDAPAPGQTTERSGNDPAGNKTYNFSHRPREGSKIDISGPSNGKRLRPSRLSKVQDKGSFSKRRGSEEALEDVDKSDDSESDNEGMYGRHRNVHMHDNHQSNGLTETGRREDPEYTSSVSSQSEGKTVMTQTIKRRHEDEEPDVGPGGDEPDGPVIRRDPPPPDDARQERNGPGLEEEEDDMRPLSSNKGSSATGTDPHAHVDMAGITLLGQPSDGTSSYGDRTSSLRGSKDGLHMAMKGGKKQNKAQASSMPDYKSSVQRFVDGQASTTNMTDPNAPSPSPRSKSSTSTPASASSSFPNNASSTLSQDEEDNMGMSAKSEEIGRSRSQLSGSQSETGTDEPVMTVRFEHVTTEDGHHVVTGREGQLEKCEDEPITTPGAVQVFGVLMVLEEDYEKDELTVRQVSENSTDILGLSPRYLFKLPCFTQVLSRHQAHVLRDNLDYLPDPDTGDTTLTDEGPHVFLLNGEGEPGSGIYASDEASSSSVSEDRRREWTCWVAAHRPVQKTGPNQDDEPAAPTRNLIILEFELEKDFRNPLYPPQQKTTTSDAVSPASGSNVSAIGETGGSVRSATSASTLRTITGSNNETSTGSSTTRPSVALTPRQNSNNSVSIVSGGTLRQGQGNTLGGLEGEDVEINPSDILESTTSHAKPLRALERLRRMTRNQTASSSDGGGSGGSSGTRGGRPRNKRRGTGSGGVGTMDVFAVLAQINDQLSQAPDLENFLKIVVGVIKDLTQFHRCLVYSFDAQWNGQAVAELVDWEKTHDLYKGLQFPATDIPAQARELYRINKVRMLYDRAHPTARMVLRSKRDLDQPLDMTHCYLRAMSPIHLVYLRNMGVRSSMSISIMAFGSLWGLIACHGYGEAGMRVSFPVRQMLRLLSDSVSRNIERLSYAARLHTRKLISTIPTDSHPTGYIVSNANDLLHLFDADCGVLVIGEGAKILGSSTEHGQEILLIAEYLRYKRYGQMQISSHIAEDFPELMKSRNLQIISGLLYVPLSTGGQDFIAFLRKGQSREVHWAGKPYKEGKEKGANLEPRQSFKVWSETIAGKSKNWTDEQLETAGVLALVYGKFIEVWRQKESALRANQMTSLLLNNATHEVRTPLNHIINYLELALDGQLDNETRENLSRSHVASKSLLFTINDLLDLTRIESGNETAFNDPFDLGQCIQDAARIYSSEAKRRNLKFDVDTKFAPDGMVLGDQKKIRTVVANLIANAVKYTTTGEISISCRVKGENEEGVPPAHTGFLKSEIIIADTGCGIPAEKLQAMFVTFEQADSGQSPQTTGLGLGLAVVARIVEQVGGTLRADSEFGVGTRFYFNLTMARHEGTATTSSAPPSEQALIKTPRRSGSMGSGSGGSMVSGGSGGTRELDNFVDAFSVSHMARGTENDERIAAAEARMNQPGTFAVTDSSWPIRPAKMESGKQSNATARPGLPRSQSAYNTPAVTTRSPRLRIQTSNGHGHSGSVEGCMSDTPPSPTTTYYTSNTEESYAKADGGVKPTKRRKQKPPGEILRILVVEDDDVNRKILERRLKLDGHDVVSVINGQEAVDQFKQDLSFDCVLMDIQMPVMDGRKSAETIRQYEGTLGPQDVRGKTISGRIPILAVSATLLESERTQMATYFDGWVLKPIDFKRMLRLLSGITKPELRKEDAYVRGEWERGGWLNVAHRKSQH